MPLPEVTAPSGILYRRQVQDQIEYLDGVAGTATQPGDLSTVATTGAYSDLTGAPAAGLNETFVPIWAEENNTLGDGTYEWAFGNGADTPTNNGIPIYVPANYQVHIVAVGASTNTDSGSSTIEVEVNGSILGASDGVQVSLSGRSAINDSFAPYAISSGDRINFRTITAGTNTAPNVAVAWLRYSSSVVPVNNVAPSISGTPEVGETLTATPGSWTNAGAITGQWLVDGVPQVGETGLTFVLPALANGASITYQETAGAVSATSNALTFVGVALDVRLLVNGQTGAVDQSVTSKTFLTSTLGTSTVDVIAPSTESFICNGSSWHEIQDDGDFSFRDGAANKDFTIEVWVKYLAGFGINDGIIGRDGPTSARYLFWAASTGLLEVFGGGNILLLQSTSLVNDGNNHHIAWTREGDVNKLWIDGVEEDSTTNAHIYNDAAGLNFFIGRDPESGSRIWNNGLIDGVRVSHTAVYTSGFTPPPPPLSV